MIGADQCGGEEGCCCCAANGCEISCVVPVGDRFSVGGCVGRECLWPDRSVCKGTMGSSV